MQNKYKKIAEEILEYADIKINGGNSWDIQVYNEDFYHRAITEGELGIGESYMEGWWDVNNVDEFIFRILRAHLDEKIKRNFRIMAKVFSAKIFNFQSKNKSFYNGQRHYDLGNDLFQNMLDQRMNYSCAYWKETSDLDRAQENKLDLICRKLYLKPGMRVLDIGCGWGAFGKYAAEKYNVEVVGITVSKEQVKLGENLCKGLPVKFHLMDYRDLNEKFDRLVSVGMIEHVGCKNYRTFFEIAHKSLKDDGLFLLHTIGSNISQNSINLWTAKYIFPNALIPSIAQLGKAIEKLFVVEDWHNFGTDYDKTLISWYNNFINNWEKIKNNYPNHFFRMWKYYLLSSAASFRSRSNQLWQIVLSKNGILNGYHSVR
ncbi:MAG: cyclopropane fatty acyl phospholipid synthase [Bacteroidota bacterium]|nr:cyclopropane fatty acyl phospholipid synthase [Bacteroidota bacterium]